MSTQGQERWAESRGARVVRHWGDPPAEWQAATEGVALRDRSHRGRLRFHGRQPAAMLSGVITGRIPEAPGCAEYSVVLTPKGRVVSDLRLFREAPDAAASGAAAPVDTASAPLFADVPRAGVEPLLAHLRRYLPPRMCAVEDVSETTGHITLMGPHAASALAKDVFGLRIDPDELEALADDRGLEVDLGGPRPVIVVRTHEVATPAWDVFGDRTLLDALQARLVESGARRVGLGVWEALRLEAGRPAFGADIDETCIPIEAGIDTRAIDHQKGCYTGQEVIVRIRDRGHVNRHLRLLRLGDLPTPAPGTELFEAGAEPDRPVGSITSSALSPRAGTLALAYVRREVEVPGVVRLGAPDGPEISVETRPAT
jgi:folate-binding protein YgfZ